MIFDRVKLYIIFLAGNMFCQGSTFYKQESMGLEKYIEFVTKHWVDYPPAGMFLMCFGGIIFILCVVYDL